MRRRAGESKAEGEKVMGRYVVTIVMDGVMQAAGRGHSKHNRHTTARQKEWAEARNQVAARGASVQLLLALLNGMTPGLLGSIRPRL